MKLDDRGLALEGYGYMELMAGHMSGPLFLRCITGDEVYESNGHELFSYASISLYKSKYYC